MEMTTILVVLWAFIVGIDDVSTKLFRRPLLICTVVGIIMGDLTTALAIGATLEIMWMGIGNVGAYMAPDIVSGSVISCALAIMSGGGVATAVTLAVPTAVLSQQLLVLYETINCALNPWAAKLAENADVKGTFWLVYPSMILAGLIRAVPAFIALQFGAGAITDIVNSLPEVVITGLSTSGKIIPSVGIALLMILMIKNAQLWIFLILGFVLTAYLGLSVLPVTLIALAFAYIYDLATNNKNTVVQVNQEEGSYDL